MKRTPLINLLLSALGLAWLAFAAPCATAAEPPEEYAVKAALVYNFARFTQWPEGSFADEDSPLRLCILAGDEFRDAFDAMDGRRVGERVVDVCYAADARGIEGSHVVFVPQGSRELWPQVRAALADTPVLTVGEMNGFLGAGGMMNLVLSDGRIVFRVNLHEVRRTGLGISSRLLKLAEQVIETEDGR